MPAYAQGTAKAYLTVSADATMRRGQNFTVTVTAKDGAGATVTTETGTVTLTLLSPDGSDTLGTGTVVLVAGVGTLTTEQITGGSGSDSGAIRAALSGYMDGVSGTIAIVNDYLTVTADASVVRGAAFALTVTAKNGLTDATITTETGTATLVLTNTLGDTLTPATIALVAGVGTTAAASFTGGTGSGTGTITAALTGYTSGTSSDISMVASGSMVFNGSNSYLTFLDHAHWTPGAAYTVEFWIKAASFGSNYAVITHQQDTGNFWTLQHRPSGYPGWLFYWYEAETGYLFPTFVEGSVGTTTGSWHHIALVKDDSAFSLYRDGLRVMTATEATAIADFSGTLRIGYLNADSPFYLAARLDEVRISSVARYSGATYTTPTAQFAPDASTLLLLHGGDYTDSSSTVHVATVVGSMAIDTSDYKW